MQVNAVLLTNDLHQFIMRSISDQYPVVHDSNVIGQLLGLQLPAGMGTKDLVVVGMAAAIGFTVALFISVVAFPGGDLLDSVKMGALFSFGAVGLTFLAAKLLGVKKAS